MRHLLVLFVCSAIRIFPYTTQEVAELKKEVAANMVSMEGWCSVERGLAFVDWILKEKAEVCVDIGTYAGRSLYPMAMALRFLGSGEAIAIDPWDRFENIRYWDPEKDAHHVHWWGQLNIDYFYGGYWHMLKRFDLQGVVSTLRMTAEEAADQIDGEIDLIHIDGNHSARCSLLDVQLYLPKVRSGGTIWLNDALWKERADAVDLLLEFCDVVQHLDNSNCLVFKKR